ncbi:MAG: septal ring lytic transglycosylase RlpA family protein [Gammaproteobacteria bacterium]
MHHNATIDDTVKGLETRPAAHVLSLVASLLLIAGCAGPSNDFLPGKDGGPSGPVDVSNIPNAVPHVEPRSESGNPSSYVVAGRRYHVLNSAHGYVKRGIASWYGRKFHGRLTASGERYNMYAMTAAHRTLPLPTYVRVTNLRNGRHVIVKVNDRGPFARNRLIDLSYAAAKKLGITGHGTAPVEVRAIDPRTYQRRVAEHRPPTPPAPVPHESASAETPDHSAVGGGGVYLQVGAYSSFDNAEHMLKRLDDQFHSVHISAGLDAGRARIYRVRIGPIRGTAEESHAMQTLERLGQQFTRNSLE